MAVTVILIGGPMDGKRVAIHDGQTRFDVVERPAVTFGELADRSGDLCIPRTGSYRRGSDRQVFNWEGWAAP